MKVQTIHNLEFTKYHKLRVIVEVKPELDDFAFHHLEYVASPTQMVCAFKTQEMSDYLGTGYIHSNTYWTTNFINKVSLEYLPTIIKYNFTLCYHIKPITHAILQEIYTYANKDIDSAGDQWEFFSHLNALASYYH